MDDDNRKNRAVKDGRLLTPAQLRTTWNLVNRAAFGGDRAAIVAMHAIDVLDMLEAVMEERDALRRRVEALERDVPEDGLRELARRESMGVGGE